MKFSLTALLWLTTCICLLLGLLSVPQTFLRHYRLINLNTAEVTTLWPVEIAGRVALVVFTFFVGLRVIRDRYFKKP